MPYPWDLGEELTHTDLNAIIGQVIANTATAQTAAATALGLAQATQANLGPPKPVAVTLNWPAIPVTAGTYVLSATLPYNFLASSLDVFVGSNGGSFNITPRANAQVIGATSNIPVSVALKTNVALVAGPSNPLTLNAGSVVDIVVSSVVGTPVDAYVCLNGFRTS